MVLEWPERSPWAVVVGAGGLAEAIIEKLIRMKFKVVVCCRRSRRRAGTRRVAVARDANAIRRTRTGALAWPSVV
jgi:shikimate 5-dehydrogenase